MLDVFRGISSQDIALAMRHMNAQNYVEHNPLVDGRFEGARRYLDQVAARRPDWKLIRVFRDGAYVVTQVGGRLPDQGVFFDVFRFEDALIVEHWAFSAEAGPPNKSGHMQVDGATEPKSGEDVNAEVNLTHLRPDRRSKSDPPRSMVAMVVRGGRSPERTIVAGRLHCTAAVRLAA